MLIILTVSIVLANLNILISLANLTNLTFLDQFDLFVGSDPLLVSLLIPANLTLLICLFILANLINLSDLVSLLCLANLTLLSDLICLIILTNLTLLIRFSILVHLIIFNNSFNLVSLNNLTA